MINIDPIAKVKDAQGEIPPYNATVVHLRLGDSLKHGDDCWEVESDCLHRHKAWKREHPDRPVAMYAYPKAYYERLLPPPQPEDRLNVRHLIVVCSLKHGDAAVIKKSIAYLKQFTGFAEERGYTVTHRIDGGSADDDLIYMVNAARFIPGGGGFSELIESIRNA